VIQDQAVKLRCRGLIEARFLLHAENTDRFEQSQDTKGIRIGSILGAFERDRDMALRGKVVNLRWPNLLHEAYQVRRIRHVAVVHQEWCLHVLVRIPVEMVDTRSVERGRAAFDAVHVVTLGKQEIGQIGAVLSRHTGNQSSMLLHYR
jgi:hypothetical protein